MARIPEFNETAELHPNDTGMEVAAQAGRRIGAFYHQIGEDTGGLVKQLGDQYQQQVSMQEISRVQKDAATLHSNLLNGWDAASAAADPNDTTVADKFRPAMEDQIEQLSDGVSTKDGKEYVLRQQGAIRDSVTMHVQAGMIERAANAAHLNFEQTNNTNQSTAIDHPEQLGFLAQQTDDNTEALIKSHSLPPEQAAVLRDEALKSKGALIKAAAIGATLKNPAGAPEAVGSLLEDPKYQGLTNVAEKEQLYGFAKEAQDHAASEARIQEATVHKQQVEDADKAALQAGALISVDQNGNYTAQPGAADAITKYETLPGANRATAEAMKANLVRAQKVEKDVADDPTVYGNLTARIGDKTNAPITKDEVLGYQARGLLSAKSADMFLKATDKPPMDPLTQHVYETGKQTVEMFINSYIAPKDPSGNYKDPTQARNAAAFQAMFNGLWDQTVGSGQMTPDQFLQTTLNPASPAYLGHYVGRFQVGKGALGDRTQAQTQQMISGKPPTIPASQAADLNARAATILNGALAKPAPKKPAGYVPPGGH